MTECKSKLGHEKGAWAVDRARVELHRHGHSVSMPEHVCKTGPDLVVTIAGGKSFNVEVKLAMVSKCRGGPSWRVNRVTRTNDYLIAIVFPSGYVHFEAMKHFLKLVPNGRGDRYLGALGRFFG